MKGAPIPRLFRYLRSSLLVLLACAGTVCIIATLMAAVGGYSLVLFKTGSMSPTIPAGSLALVRKISASDIRVGDVITVDRAGKLPVTHRVTAVHPSTAPGRREVTLKGDANEYEDAEPYDIESARIVVWSAAGLAEPLIWLTRPWAVGIAALGVSTIIVWAFWPRKSAHAAVPDESNASPAHSGNEDEDQQPTPPASFS